MIQRFFDCWRIHELHYLDRIHEQHTLFYGHKLDNFKQNARRMARDFLANEELKGSRTKPSSARMAPSVKRASRTSASTTPASKKQTPLKKTLRTTQRCEFLEWSPHTTIHGARSCCCCMFWLIVAAFAFSWSPHCHCLLHSLVLIYLTKLVSYPLQTTKKTIVVSTQPHLIGQPIGLPYFLIHQVHLLVRITRITTQLTQNHQVLRRRTTTVVSQLTLK